MLKATAVGTHNTVLLRARRCCARAGAWTYEQPASGAQRGPGVLRGYLLGACVQLCAGQCKRAVAQRLRRACLRSAVQRKPAAAASSGDAARAPSPLRLACCDVYAEQPCEHGMSVARADTLKWRGALIDIDGIDTKVVTARTNDAADPNRNKIYCMTYSNLSRMA